MISMLFAAVVAAQVYPAPGRDVPALTASAAACITQAAPRWTFIPPNKVQTVDATGGLVIADAYQEIEGVSTAVLHTKLTIEARPERFRVTWTPPEMISTDSGSVHGFREGSGRAAEVDAQIAAGVADKVVNCLTSVKQAAW